MRALFRLPAGVKGPRRGIVQLRAGQVNARPIEYRLLCCPILCTLLGIFLGLTRAPLPQNPYRQERVSLIAPVGRRLPNRFWHPILRSRHPSAPIRNNQSHSTINTSPSVTLSSLRRSRTFGAPPVPRPRPTLRPVESVRPVAPPRLSQNRTCGPRIRLFF
jgi:hypothetical protein